MWGTLINIVIAQLIAFAVVVIILKRILLNDTMSAVKRLREVEADLARKEDAVKRKIEENEKDFLRRSAEAREELERAKEAAERETEKQRQAALAEARRESDRIIKDARLNEDRTRREILAELDTKAVESAIGIFALVFGKEITATINREFVGELIAALDGLDASSISVDLNDVQFVASHPLDAEQKRRIGEILSAKFNAQINVQEKVDSELLAGLVIKLGDLEIDGSLRNHLREAAAELKRKQTL